MKDPGAPRQADLTSRIALCRQDDVVLDGGTMTLKRTEVVWTWARVKSYYGLQAFMNPRGIAILDSVNKPTHLITIRAGLDLDISSAAWAYEERRKSPPRWYKLTGFSDSALWIYMTALLDEKSETAMKPQPPEASTLLPQLSRVEL